MHSYIMWYCLRCAYNHDNVQAFFCLNGQLWQANVRLCWTVIPRDRLFHFLGIVVLGTKISIPWTVIRVYPTLSDMQGHDP